MAKVPEIFIPVMVIMAPFEASTGEKEVIIGAGIKVNPLRLAAPPGVTRLTAPVEPLPTSARIDVEETTVNDFTLAPPSEMEEAPEKWLPWMLITDPATAAAGEILLMMGAGIKINPLRLATPPGVTKLTAPLDPLPTKATIVLEERTVNAETCVPPRVIIDVPSKLLPVMVIKAPVAAAVGVKDVMMGGGIKINPFKVAMPPGVVRPSEPEEPLPTIAIIVVDETRVNEVTGVPPRVIIDVPSKLLPVMVINAPVATAVGVKDVMMGGGIKINPFKVAVPPGVVRPSAPEEPLPTIATMVVDETTVNAVTGVPPRVIIDVPSKLLPVMLIKAPVATAVGVKDVMMGGGINVKPFKAAVPPGVVKLSTPDEPLPTIATMVVDETRVNEVTGVPPRVIIDVPSKLLPVMVINAPVATAVGVNEVMIGGGINVKPFKLAVPPGVVKLSAPVEPLPILATMLVDETTVNAVTGVSPRVIIDVPSKLLPVMLINAPVATAVGVKDVMMGGGINVKPFKAAVPPGVVRPSAPEEPLPTIATMVVDETTVNAVTEVPPRVIIDVPSKLLPVIVINAPVAAAVGVKEVVMGGGININPFKVAVPPGVVRPSAPDEPLPTIATIEVDETRVNAVTEVPPRVIIDVPSKLLPVMLINAPVATAVGVKEVMMGGGINVKPFKLAVPPGVVKLSAPVEPLPILATTEVDETTVNVVTGVSPRVIIDVPSKLLPVIVINAPVAAAEGVKEVMMGGGININPFKVAVPPGVVRLIAPEEPLPTIATIEVDETRVNAVTGVPPRVIIDVPSKLLPVMLINAPVAAAVGVKDVMIGGGIKINPFKVAVPPGVVRLSAPEEPLPTIATMVVDETTVNEVTEVPPKVMADVLERFIPMMVN
jgi:hypothetical protein